MQYDLGQKHPNRFAPKDTIEESLGRPNKDIRSLLAMFQTKRGRSSLQRQAGRALKQLQQRAINNRYEDLYRRPNATEDRLFEPGYLHRHYDSRDCSCSELEACKEAQDTLCKALQCDHSRLVARGLPRTQASDRQTNDGTAEQQVQIVVGRVGSGDTLMRDGLDRDRIAGENDLVAFEMEGAGVWDEVPCIIIIKAICDYADSHKNDKWQQFAAAIGASTTKAVIEEYTHTDDPSAPRTWFLIPYNENPDFVRRSETLDQIRRLFGHEQHLDKPRKPRSRVALYGLGGIGKTQIALAYAFWLQHTYPDVSVFWVHASNAERFRQAYGSIAEECSIPGHEDPKANILLLVKTWLEKGVRGRWLMVIDNADDLELFFPSLENDTINPNQCVQAQGGFRRYLPECRHGSILMTTKNKQVGSRLVWGKQVLEVKKMDNSETQQLIHALLEDDIPAEDTFLLSTRLEHLPMALAQAAAFIHENGISVKTYIQLLDKSDSNLVALLSEPFEAIGRDSATPHALTATWIISFNQIQQQSVLASEILSMVSLLDRQAIPQEFIARYCGTHSNLALQTDVAAVIKALGTLKAFSFISEAQNGTIDTHRLVQLATRKWLSNQGKLAKFAKHALETVSDLFPYGEYESRQVCRDYLPHAKAVLQIMADLPRNRAQDCSRAKLLHRMAGYFSFLGQWKDAEKCAAESVNLRMDRLGNEDPATLASMAKLASTYRDQGRWNKAEELEVQVMETSIRVSGEAHSNTLTSKDNLASTFLKQGQWKKAEELNLQVMETRKKVLGEAHSDTLLSANNLAAVYKEQKRYKDAEKLFKWVKETNLSLLGEGHPNTLTSTSNLATVYMCQERWEEAKELQLLVMEGFQATLGKEHFDTLSSMANLASTYMHMHQSCWRKAEELSLEVIETRTRVLGEEHPETLESMGNLATMFGDQSRWKEAGELEERVMKIRTKVLGEGHPDTLTSIAYLARTFEKQGRGEDALGLMREWERRSQASTPQC
ncbi:hypothetical protein LZ30DRAFT_709881 [Colletotrichum cereale]|nr:hypothetical protein LZ30DRAFT_709881 [Colletotrichum cereale]